VWVFSIQRIEKIEEVEDVVMAEQKEMLLILFQRLVIVLSNHFQRCEADGVSTQTMWLHRTLGHLREISRLYRKEVSSVRQMQSALRTGLHDHKYATVRCCAAVWLHGHA
jgi:hypothetical protein